MAQTPNLNLNLPANGSEAWGDLVNQNWGTLDASIHALQAWATAYTPDVTSVFGRTGVIAAETGDYTFAMIAGTLAPSQMPAIAATTLSGTVPISGGGTGATTAAAARSALGAAATGANGDITSLTALGTLTLAGHTVSAVQGSGSTISIATGSFVPGNLRSTDANGNDVDAGVAVSAIAAAQTSATSAQTTANAAQTTANAAQPSSAKGQPNGYAALDANGLVPSAQMPPLAIDHTYVVASQAAMLALAANVGDVAIRSDTNQTFILQTAPGTTLGNWQQMLAPAAPVQSVNGQTGNVTTVSSVAATVANGITATVSNPSSTPSIALGLGAITPTSVSTGTVTATTLALSGTSATSMSGTSGILGTVLSPVSGNVARFDANGNLTATTINFNNLPSLLANNIWSGTQTFTNSITLNQGIRLGSTGMADALSLQIPGCAINGYVGFTLFSSLAPVTQAASTSSSTMVNLLPSSAGAGGLLPSIGQFWAVVGRTLQIKMSGVITGPSSGSYISGIFEVVLVVSSNQSNPIVIASSVSVPFWSSGDPSEQYPWSVELRLVVTATTATTGTFGVAAGMVQVQSPANAMAQDIPTLTINRFSPTSNAVNTQTFDNIQAGWVFNGADTSVSVMCDHTLIEVLV